MMGGFLFYSFLKIFIVVMLAIVLIDWLAGRQAQSWTNIPNAPGWASLSSNFKIRSAMANESPQGTAPLLDETFLPGDIEYESPKGNVRIYFPIVTAIVLSVLVTLIDRGVGRSWCASVLRRRIRSTDR
jgi:Protein of unknown function (DUF2905)